MNFNIRKFNNDDAQEVASGGGFNIAEMMAKHGVQNSSDVMVAQPLDISGKEEKPNLTETESPVVPTTDEVKVEDVNTQSPPATEEAVVILETQTEQEVQKQPTWQEVLKSQQPDTVFKELGIDDSVVNLVKDLKEVDPKMVAFLNHWKTNNGDVTEYLKELSTDYSKMSAEDVMRHQLRQDYPKASDRALEVLYKKEIVEKYNLDSSDDAELEEGQLLLEAKAEKFRDDLTANQQKFLLPKPQEPKEDVVNNTEQILQQQEYDRYKTQVNTNPLTKDLIASKQLVIGEGEDKFNLPVSDPNALTNILFDSQAWKSKFFSTQLDANGAEVLVPDVEKQLLVSAVINDHKGVLRELAKHYKSLGGKAAIDPIENAKQPEGSTASKSEQNAASPAEAMGKHGRLVG